MITRKDFLARGAAALAAPITAQGESIGVSGRARGLLGGAFMGAMMAQQSKAYTARDYVQDGLVALWDGIENGGFDTHQISGSSWINCIQGSSIGAWTLTNGRCDFGNDSIVCTKFINVAGHGATLASVPSFVTSEVCVRIDDTQDTSTNAEAIVWHAYRHGLFCHQSGYTYYTAAGIRRKYSNGGIGKGLGAGLITYDRNAVSAWKNAVGIDVSESSSNTSVPDKAEINGRDTTTINRSFSGHVYCMRLYNRSLSAAEIAANWEIDKARFNLP